MNIVIKFFDIDDFMDELLMENAPTSYSKRQLVVRVQKSFKHLVSDINSSTSKACIICSYYILAKNGVAEIYYLEIATEGEKKLDEAYEQIQYRLSLISNIQIRKGIVNIEMEGR